VFVSASAGAGVGGGLENICGAKERKGEEEEEDGEERWSLCVRPK
jgi:hypothetical protein